jgi:cytochrome c
VVPEGKKIMEQTDCKACHTENKKVSGPSYLEIAKKYTKNDRNYLIDRIIKGGSGVWGEEAIMSAHPQLEVSEVRKMVDYILSLNPDKNFKEQLLPISGTVEFKEHTKVNGGGKYVLMVSYLDKGHENIPNSTLSGSAQIIFKAPKIEAEDMLLGEGLSTWSAGGAELVGSIRHNTHIGLENISLKTLKSISFSAFYAANYNYKGILEVRQGSPTGTIIGSQELGYFNETNEAFKNYTIKLQPTANEASLYFVFKNFADTEQYVANANWFTLNY